jgi:ribonuclease-3
MNDGLEKLQQRLGVRFKNIHYLQRALTHRSAATDNALESNERLEFLGDSVVGLVVCENLFRRYPDYSEGDLAKSKAYIVSEPALAAAAQALGLEEFVVMSSSEAASGGRRRRSILADAFEAVVAAIYLDCGIRAARRVVRDALLPALEEVITDQHRRDYKSSLQEHTQARAHLAPLYRIVSEEGREHEKVFTAQVLVGERIIGEGTGRSKKEAEQAAAQNALDQLSLHFPEPSAEAAPPDVKNGVQ